MPAHKEAAALSRAPPVPGLSLSAYQRGGVTPGVVGVAEPGAVVDGEGGVLIPGSVAEPVEDPLIEPEFMEPEPIEPDDLPRLLRPIEDELVDGLMLVDAPLPVEVGPAPLDEVSAPVVPGWPDVMAPGWPEVPIDWDPDMAPPEAPPAAPLCANAGAESVKAATPVIIISLLRMLKLLCWFVSNTPPRNLHPLEPLRAAMVAINLAKGSAGSCVCQA